MTGRQPRCAVRDGDRRQLRVSDGWFTLTDHIPQDLDDLHRISGAAAWGTPAVESVDLLVVPNSDTALGLLADDSADLALGHIVIDPVARRQDVAEVVRASPFGCTRFELVWPDGAAGRGGTGPRTGPRG